MSGYTLPKQADAFEALAELSEDYGDVAFVDYPWNFMGKNHSNGGRSDEERVDDWNAADNDRLAPVLENLARVLKGGRWVYLFADDKVLPKFREAVENSPLTYRKTLIWDTEYIGMGHYYRSRHQYVIAATNGDTDRYVRDQPTVLTAPVPSRTPGTEAVYPTGKPPSIYEQLIEPVTQPGERVLEPFCGSAPGAMAAHQLRREYWGCDISREAIAAARKRAESDDADRQATL